MATRDFKARPVEKTGLYFSAKSWHAYSHYLYQITKYFEAFSLDFQSMNNYYFLNIIFSILYSNAYIMLG